MSSKSSLTVEAWKSTTPNFVYFEEPQRENTPGKFTYNSQNDFGREITTLLFTKPSNQKGEYFYKAYCADLLRVAKIEGFDIKLATSMYTVRDAKCPLGDGKTFLELTCSSYVEKALDRCRARNGHLKNHTSYLTKHPVFYQGTLGIASMNKLHKRSFEGVPDSRQKNGRIYYEGGDGFFATNAQGIPKYLVGEDLFFITHMVLRQNGWFKNPNATQQDGSKTEAFGNEQILYRNDSLSQRFRSGKIYQQVETESRSILQSLTEDVFQRTFSEMCALTLILNDSLSTPERIELARQYVATYLAQQKIVREEVFPHELRVEKHNLVPVPQIAYHLDVLMTPGPKGSFFMQSYQESLALLMKIKENAAELNLSQKDLELLDIYLENANQLLQDLEPFMEGVSKTLSEAGFRVIKTPGAFFSTLKNGEWLNVNFFNAISGYSSQTKHLYYIVGGVKIGDRLGEVLMDAYSSFLKNHCGSDIAVYFIGGKDYEEAMHLMNRKTSQLGLHCISFELEVKPQDSI